MKKPARTAGPLKAAYIYTLLPGRVRTAVMNVLNTAETGLLNRALGGVPSLTSAQCGAVLREFIGSLREARRRRERYLETGLGLSMTAAALLLTVSLFYGMARSGRAGAALDFAESILRHGGLHVVLLPLLLGYVRSTLPVPLSRYITAPGAQPLIDAAAGAGTGGLIALVLAGASGAGGLGSLDPAVRVFYAVVSISLGPFVEELFFRLQLFLLPGGRYGYGPMAVVSSLAFTLAHLPDTPLLFAGYFVCGMALALLAWARRGILAPFLAHGLANFLLLVL